MGRRRNRPKRGKATAQFLHAKRRAMERYGIDLTRGRMAELVAVIQNGEGTMLERQSNRVSVRNIPVDEDGRMATVVYDSLRKQIASFLPYTEPGDEIPVDA